MGDANLKAILEPLASRMNRDPKLPVDKPTTSYWQVPPHSFYDQQSKTLPENADIIIIGSGIAGVSVATHLLRQNENARIVMLEARGVTSGATGRNGGHIKAASYLDYADLKAQLGQKSAIKITKFRLAHLDAMVKEAEALGDAGKPGLVRRVDSLSAFYDQDSWEKAKAAREAFLQDMPEEAATWKVLETQEELQNVGLKNAVGCIRGPAGAAWPYRFVGGILSKLLENSSFCLETYTPVTTIERSDSSPGPYVVSTPRGKISAKHVIHCTNGYAAHLLPSLTGKLWPLRGQMTVQSVPDTYPRLGTSRSWSTSWAHGFDYITQSAGRDGALYLGGGLLQGGFEKDEDIGNPDDSQQSSVCLEHLATVPKRAFGIETGNRIESKWTGIMGFTGDGLPLVGKLDSGISGRASSTESAGSEWIAAGWNGYGMVHCWLAGKALAAMVNGNDSDTAEWFPLQEFACTRARIDNMSAMGALEYFASL